MGISLKGLWFSAARSAENLWRGSYTKRIITPQYSPTSPSTAEGSRQASLGPSFTTPSLSVRSAKSSAPSRTATKKAPASLGTSASKQKRVSRKRTQAAVSRSTRSKKKRAAT